MLPSASHTLHNGQKFGERAEAILICLYNIIEAPGEKVTF